MRKFVTLILLLAIFTSAYAQDGWSLERCIQYALENNIQIKTQELNTQIYNNQLQQSKLGILPGLNAGANENFTFGRSVDPYTNEFLT
jgi:outer membrane protein